MPLILSGNVASATASTGYTVANSCRFNSADSAYMAITPAGAGSTRKLSFSCWFKLTELAATRGGAYNVFHSVYDGTNKWVISIDDSDKLFIGHYNGSSWDMLLNSNQVLRDLSAFYSLIVIIDTEEGTDTNRAKVFLNGTQVTSWSTETYPAEDFDGIWCKDSATEVGRYAPASAQYGGFYLAEVVSCDGQTYTTTDFGEFDEDSPTIWKPIDVSGLTFGTNGFYLDFEDSANLGNDANGGTDLTESNLDATDQATDTPTNNFATWNSNTLLGGAVAVYSEGNLKSVQPTGGASKSISNIGVSTGKWYIEVKQTAVSNPLGNGEQLIGVISDTFSYSTTALDGALNYSYVLRNYNGTKSENGSSGSGWHGDWTAGDIIGIGLDMDNHRVYFSKGGQWSDGSGNWDESSPSGYLTLSSVPTFYFVCAGIQHSTAGATYAINSGSPSFAI